MPLTAVRTLLGIPHSDMVRRAIDELEASIDAVSTRGDSLARQLATVEEVQTDTPQIIEALSLALGEPVSAIRVIANRRDESGSRPLTWLRNLDSTKYGSRADEICHGADQRYLFSEAMDRTLGGYLRRRLRADDRFARLERAYDADTADGVLNLRATFWRGLEDQLSWGIKEVHLCFLGAALIGDRETFDALTPFVTRHLLRSPPLMRDPHTSMDPADDNAWILFAR